MIRCQVEVVELALDKKGIESRELGEIVRRRLSFEEVLRRDELRWRGIAGATELRCLAERAQRELVAGDFARFVDWMSATHGHAFARAAGLPVGRPRLELAS
ncbi:MAG: hypothetical protein U1F43_10750 [Myxococcota bacterium]